MSRYDYFPNSAPPRKKHRGLKIFLGILAVLIVAGGIAFALNYRTVMFFAGKGTVSVPAASSVEQALKASGDYEDVKTSTDAAGNTVVTARSKDGAVTVRSTTGSAGDQKVEVRMDAKEMQGISSAKSLSNLQAVKDKVNQYLEAVISPSELSGVESYVAREVFAQYQSGQSTFSVSHDFGGTQLDVTGSFETGVVEVNAERPAGSSK